ncbi:MAG: hypothetical protein H3C50_07505 [Kiritimatiellae bacterium]|nr:hypothetical protein [Kiritimatiellia bacterium]
MITARTTLAHLLVISAWAHLSWLTLATESAPLPADLEASPANAQELPSVHPPLYQLAPSPSIAQPPASAASRSRERLKQLEEMSATNSYASPLVGSSLFAIQADTSPTPDQPIRQAELKLLRERVDRANQLFSQGQQNEALELILDSKRLTQDPRLQAKLLNQLALYHFRLQQYSNALDYANQATDLLPYDLASQANLAAALLTTGEIPLAIELLQHNSERIALAPRFAFVTFFNLACAHSLQGDFGKAFQYLRRAGYADPASTLASLGDPQLDAIRDRPDFQTLRDFLLRTPSGPSTASP